MKSIKNPRLLGRNKREETIQKTELVEPNTSQIQEVRIIEPKRTFWRNWRSLNGAALIVSIVALAVTAYSTQLAFFALDEAARQTDLSTREITVSRQALEETQIVAAWQIINARSPGNSGKRRALEYLNKQKESLNGINLSCKALGGVPDELGNCAGRAFLQELNIPSGRVICSDFSYADLVRANFHRANVAGTKFDFADFRGAIFVEANLEVTFFREAFLGAADFTDANMQGANLHGSKLMFANFNRANLHYADMTGVQVDDGSFRDATLEDANLSGAIFGEDFNPIVTYNNDNGYLTERSDPSIADWDTGNYGGDRADFTGANLSGTQFCGLISAATDYYGCSSITQEQIDQAWAWEDNPPIFRTTDEDGNVYEREDLKPPTLCNTEKSWDYFRQNKRGRPVNC